MGLFIHTTYVFDPKRQFFPDQIRQRCVPVQPLRAEHCHYMTNPAGPRRWLKLKCCFHGICLTSQR